MVVENDITTEEKKASPPDAGVPVKEVPVKGAFNRYDSPFLQLVAPLVATRYFWLALEDINPFNILRKPKPEDVIPNFKKWVPPSFGGTLRRNFAALGMGITFLSIIGFYSKNTLHDIKSLYAEAVGLELGKKTEDVTLADVFMRSQNEALKVTRKAYIYRTMARLATAATFFIPWHKFRDYDYDKPKYDANANAGVGAMGAYLLGEGFLRDPSFFDMEQSLVINAIHHTNQKSYETIQPKNIQTLMMLQRKHLNKNHEWPATGSEEGQNELKVALRITSLMNQTYRNSPNTENASFTLGKFNYLIGFGLLNKFPESLAFVELANRSTDMQDVNNAAAAIKAGKDATEVFAQYGIDISAFQKNSASAMSAPDAAPPLAVQPEIAAKSFADTVGRVEKKSVQPKSHVDFAEQTSTPNLGV